ncbi:ABC transporter substrate-binding protein [Actinomyces sp. 2119]|uniref:ABC transporter substrate-binding protein n=1 Tax=Actinomyces lilanjuaniae TaxID=2321394 RepID=A0ABM6Z5R2_9ACTO|nr:MULTISPECIES: ABC transporter substrate-binding protein [Actinomyces]AYD90314.1 ABC transporter substrate-binding protein [Actinomyces lilanjuaniae]RJF40884.1 ABC transporter substrate-binding protein [Actinomyces sp. 2119]
MPTPDSPTGSDHTPDSPVQEPDPSAPGLDPGDDSGDVTADNAADILAEEEAVQPGDSGSRPSRRRLLAVGGLAAAAVVGVGSWLTLRRTNQGVIGAAEELPLVIGGDICAAPLYAAYHQGYFDDAGLNVTLARTQRTEDTKDALSAGKYIGAPGIFFSWLEPIYNGINAKLTAGFHSGCLQLVVGNDSPASSYADLKGATIGVPSLSSSAFAYFSIGLARAGIDVDPEHGDITWTTIDEDSLGTRLTNGDVDAIMGSDPAPLLPVFDGAARVIESNDEEPFCCAVALNGDFVSRRPDEARALTEAWLKGSDYLAASEANRKEIARIEVDNSYVAADQSLVEQVLETYGWRASATAFREAIEPGIEDFKITGYIDADVDAAELADTVYADLGITR